MQHLPNVNIKQVEESMNLEKVQVSNEQWREICMPLNGTYIWLNERHEYFFEDDSSSYHEQPT